jgi:hypothetical protein
MDLYVFAAMEEIFCDQLDFDADYYWHCISVCINDDHDGIIFIGVYSILCNNDGIIYMLQITYRTVMME